MHHLIWVICEVLSSSNILRGRSGTIDLLQCSADNVSVIEINVEIVSISKVVAFPGTGADLEHTDIDISCTDVCAVTCLITIFRSSASAKEPA